MTKTQQIEEALKKEAAEKFGFESWEQSTEWKPFDNAWNNRSNQCTHYYFHNRDQRIATSFHEWCNDEVILVARHGSEKRFYRQNFPTVFYKNMEELFVFWNENK